MSSRSIVSSLWQRRWLLWRFLARDLQLKYRGSFLGLFWSLLGPLLLMLVYSVVFSVVVRIPTPAPYPLFVLAGIVPWLFTARTLERACHVLLEQGAFLQRVYLPREVLVASAVGVQLVELFVSLGVFVVVASLYSSAPGAGLMLLPVWIAAHVVLIFGLALLLSLGTIFFRDLLPIVGLGLQVWFYLSPVLYPAALAAELPHGWLYGLNPMAALLEGYRAALLGTPGPPRAWLVAALLAAAAAYALGAALFRRYEAAAVKEL
jgi:ABC-type polysaccharide/polyol phosphate export permease